MGIKLKFLLDSVKIITSITVSGKDWGRLCYLGVAEDQEETHLHLKAVIKFAFKIICFHIRCISVILFLNIWFSKFSLKTWKVMLTKKA